MFFRKNLVQFLSEAVYWKGTPQCHFYSDLLTFQIKRSAIIEELFGQLILKATNTMTKT
jgi:hypothetical protein